MCKKKKPRLNRPDNTCLFLATGAIYVHFFYLACRHISEGFNPAFVEVIKLITYQKKDSNPHLPPICLKYYYVTCTHQCSSFAVDIRPLAMFAYCSSTNGFQLICYTNLHSLQCISGLNLIFQ